MIIATLGGALLGSTALLGGFAYVAPYVLKESLLNNPNDPKFYMWTQILPGRSKMVVQGGRVVEVLHGSMRKPPKVKNKIWDWYRQHVWNVTGYHAVFPYFTRVLVRGLPRFRQTEGEGENKGRKVYTPVVKGDPSFYTDHFRTDPTPWPFDFARLDVERIPFDVTGAITYYLDPKMIKDVAFKLDAWNITLDNALNSTIRGYVRQLSIDIILGRVTSDIWDKKKVSRRDFGTIQKALLKKIREYEVEPEEKDDSGTVTKAAKLLINFGIHVTQVDLNDFDPQLEDKEMARLREASYKLQEARGEDLAGQGRAKAKEHVIAVMRDLVKDYPEYADTQAKTDALVEAATKGNSIEAIVAALLSNKMGKM